MWSVWKFPIALVGTGNVYGSGRVSMPFGAKVVHAAIQNGVLTLWAEVDTQAERVERRFDVVGTGHEHAQSPGQHVGTVFSGPFVWHVYEVSE